MKKSDNSSTELFKIYLITVIILFLVPALLTLILSKTESNKEEITYREEVGTVMSITTGQINSPAYVIKDTNIVINGSVYTYFKSALVKLNNEEGNIIKCTKLSKDLGYDDLFEGCEVVIKIGSNNESIILYTNY